MQRSLLTVIGITVLALAVPGAASAHNGHGRHHHHHHRGRMHVHHAKFRFIHVGAGAGTPAPAPTTTLTPENAGTVTSYTNGVLTLTLKDGSTVSGKVTNETRIGCVKATPTTPPAPGVGTQGPGEDNGQGDDRHRGEMSRHGDDRPGDWRGGDGDDAPTTDPGPPCDSSALVTGTAVRAAELRIGPGGTEFECVWLVR